jgi:hypothetical protein
LSSGAPEDCNRFVQAICSRGLSIYDPIEIGNTDCWIPTPELEQLLDAGLRGLSLKGLPLRTRSKVVKERVCQTLGYPAPPAFRKTQPRFVGQQFDTYIQKSTNFQIWNEEIESTRRYVVIQASEQDVVTAVRVVTGEVLARLDTTGTLTQKYQATCQPRVDPIELVVPSDTTVIQPLLSPGPSFDATVASPCDVPSRGNLLSISALTVRLGELVGEKFVDSGYDQERNRGSFLHRLVCVVLGYVFYQDSGQFPDVRHQLLEVKLQTSPTIDLGLVRPNSTDPVDMQIVDGIRVRHCDVRYAVYYAQIDDDQVLLTHLMVTTGEAFFDRFRQFGGRVLNRKLQIPLPPDFFTRKPER